MHSGIWANETAVILARRNPLRSAILVIITKRPIVSILEYRKWMSVIVTRLKARKASYLFIFFDFVRLPKTENNIQKAKNDTILNIAKHYENAP